MEGVPWWLPDWLLQHLELIVIDGCQSLRQGSWGGWGLEAGKLLESGSRLLGSWSCQNPGSPRASDIPPRSPPSWLSHAKPHDSEQQRGHTCLPAEPGSTQNLLSGPQLLGDRLRSNPVLWLNLVTSKLLKLSELSGFPIFR